MNANIDAGAQYNLTYVSSSDLGTTWNAPEPLALSGGAGFYSWLATDQHGNEAITSWYNGSTTSFAQAAGCGTNPFVARSADGGAGWGGCNLALPDFNMNSGQTAVYGASRIAGKLTMGGASTVGNGIVLPGGDGGPSSEIAAFVYYQDP
jgi:hypothetical protein